jgi:hypothetical protein
MHGSTASLKDESLGVSSEHDIQKKSLPKRLVPNTFAPNTWVPKTIVPNIVPPITSFLRMIFGIVVFAVTIPADYSITWIFFHM